MSQQQQPVVSPDGRWWWDGHAWRPVHAAPPPGPMAGPSYAPHPPAQVVQPSGPRSRKVLYIVLGIVAAFFLLIGSILGVGYWVVTQGNPSALDSFQIGFHSTFSHPEVWNFNVRTIDGQQTMVFDVHPRPARAQSDEFLLQKAQLLQGIVNQYAASYDGAIEIRFHVRGQPVRTVTFNAHDSIDLSTISGQ